VYACALAQVILGVIDTSAFDPDTTLQNNPYWPLTVPPDRIEKVATYTSTRSTNKRKVMRKMRRKVSAIRTGLQNLKTELRLASAKSKSQASVAAEQKQDDVGTPSLTLMPIENVTPSTITLRTVESPPPSSPLPISCGPAPYPPFMHHTTSETRPFAPQAPPHTSIGPAFDNVIEAGQFFSRSGTHDPELRLSKHESGQFVLVTPPARYLNDASTSSTSSTPEGFSIVLDRQQPLAPLVDNLTWGNLLDWFDKHNQTVVYRIDLSESAVRDVDKDLKH